MSRGEFDQSELLSPIHGFGRLGDHLGIELLVKRDDLLPFPLAGNKVRKLFSEAVDAGWAKSDVIITNGGVESNHCRTLALMAARVGAHAHLVLHSDDAKPESSALHLLDDLGATYDVVAGSGIGEMIARRREEYAKAGTPVRVVPGGAHTPSGVRAYLEAGRQAIEDSRPTYLVVASGTGATHAGLHIAAHTSHLDVTVVGISVARSESRGREAVAEAVSWVRADAAPTVWFDARFIDGGYGHATQATLDVVASGWRHGLPLDSTYTGKAMRGLVELVREGRIAQGARVLFWHTGGLMNHLAVK